jgi:hypothetical protein
MFTDIARELNSKVKSYGIEILQIEQDMDHKFLT